MPLYDYACEKCQAQTTAFRKVDERENCPECPRCGGETYKILTAPAVQGDIPGYDCPVTGKWIEGRRAHEENLKRHGCRLRETGESSYTARIRAAEEEKLEKSIDETVERFVDSLPVQKKEQLVAEVEAGLDVNIVRE